ncbi:acyl-CoA dehydrogenase family protein [Mycobacterium aquaticum]|uniref:Acyl-CoA dehydrogenase n=1 Tax=Mycobacterium aquaticum TaxID=1927124 RepID=A0A1W9ZYN5_9MYCO|nr:acyl-CoA dehydrogenase family protein [Mycobacterium aquaticum]ORA22902.1 acyl-CoA dehydrogenase [Mycobacterium aquaticum]
MNQTQEHLAFRESVRSFIDRDLEPRYESFIEQRCFAREIWRIAGKAELLGLGVPEHLGGSGAPDWGYQAILGEELARFSLAANSCFAIHVDVVAPYLVELGTSEQHQRWLPGFCSGELVTAMGMTESAGGTDVAGIKTTAQRASGGWVLNGSKTFITNGGSADLVVVAARTTPNARSRGLSLFVVEKGMAGFTVGRKLDKIGQPESDTAELFFDDVFVPEENLLGEENSGFKHMMDRLPQERISGAVANLAHAASILEDTISYAKERQAFGQSIGSFQGMKFHLAEMATEMEVTQAYVDRCVDRHVRGELTAVDAAKAKWWSSDVQGRVLDGCVQVYGGYGYMTEYRVARAWRDARVTRIWAGTNEIMKELVGRNLGFPDVRHAGRAGSE